MSTKEKFQAVFTWKFKKPNFTVKDTAQKEGLNYEMPNYYQQKTEWNTNQQKKNSKNGVKK